MNVVVKVVGFSFGNISHRECEAKQPYRPDERDSPVFWHLTTLSDYPEHAQDRTNHRKAGEVLSDTDALHEFAISFRALLL